MQHHHLAPRGSTFKGRADCSKRCIYNGISIAANVASRFKRLQHQRPTKSRFTQLLFEHGVGLQQKRCRVAWHLLCWCRTLGQRMAGHCHKACAYQGMHQGACQFGFDGFGFDEFDFDIHPRSLTAPPARQAPSGGFAVMSYIGCIQVPGRP